MPTCRLVSTLHLHSYKIHLIYFISTLIKNGVVDDGVPTILHYRPSDLYLADSKESMMVEVGNNHDCRFLLK